MTEKIAAGATCLKSTDGHHCFIDWRDTELSGPDFCSACGLYDPNDARWPLNKPAEDDPYAWKLNVDVDPNSGAEPKFTVVEKMPVVDEQLGVPEDKKRFTTVPIPTNVMREYFTDKSLFFMVDYSTSKLKGAAFLTYLTNLDLPCDVHFSETPTYEEYEELLLAYMNQTSVINTAYLHLLAAEMLLLAKGLSHTESPYALPIIPEFAVMFISSHLELVSRWVDFIDSSQVFALSSIKALRDHFKPEERFDVVNDPNFVGPNIAQLYRLPMFIAAYFSIDIAEYKLSYYKPQFEEYMFKNERLAKYFNDKNNFAALMFQHLAMGTFTAKDINVGIFKLGVFDPQHTAYVEEPYVKPAELPQD